MLFPDNGRHGADRGRPTPSVARIRKISFGSKRMQGTRGKNLKSAGKEERGARRISPESKKIPEKTQPELN